MRPGNKQTEIGLIPEEWESSAIGELGDGNRPPVKAGPFGSALKKDCYVAKGFKVYGQEQVIRGDHLFGDYYIDRQKYRELENCAVRAGDVLLSLVGTAGKVLLIPDDAAPGIINPRLLRLSLSAEKVIPRFLVAQLSSAIFQRQLLSLFQGGTMGVLNARSIRSVQLVVPPPAEQGAIAAALSDADAAIASLERLIAKKRDIKRAAMQQLLNGQTRLPGFSGKWEVQRLGDCAHFFKGKGLPKSAITSDGTFPCIHYGELFTFYGVMIKEVASRTEYFSGAFLSRPDDVLMPTSDVTPRGLAKASCVNLGDVILGGDTLVIRPDHQRLIGTFLAAQIRHHEEQVLRLVTGSTVFHLYAADMKKFEFPVPSPAEQTAIVLVLTDMDAELAVIEAQLENTRMIKQAMMQELLTGRIRLPIKETVDA
jgi:type I restriction enzyme, S subunit